MPYDYNDTYAVDPWDSIDQDERPWYDETLRASYHRNAVYSPHVTMQVDLAAHKTKTITFSDLIPPRPNISPIGAREMNASRVRTDSYNKDVTTDRYGNGMSLHKEDELFMYWKKNGDAGLQRILEEQLGQVIVDHYDLLARNAYLTNPFAMFGVGTASGFSGVTTGDRLSTDLIDKIWLQMEDRSVPWAAYNSALDDVDQGDILCITSAGGIYDIKHEGAGSTDPRMSYIGSRQYDSEQMSRAWNKEDGTYRGVRFIKSPLAVLWNCGPVSFQTAIKAPVAPGDGAPDPTTTKVDGVRRVGQKGAKHYIEVADASGFAPGQRVTVHQLRHSDVNDPRGVHIGGVGGGGGVKFDDPMAQEMTIYAIDTASNPDRLIFKEPYNMVDMDATSGDVKGLETDLGGTVYGYVTRGRHIHTALFLHSSYNQGVVAGVTKPLELYFPPATDDYLSMTRIAYDFWAKYQIWEPQVYALAFLAGTNGDRPGATYTS